MKHGVHLRASTAICGECRVSGEGADTSERMLELGGDRLSIQRSRHEGPQLHGQGALETEVTTRLQKACPEIGFYGSLVGDGVCRPPTSLHIRWKRHRTADCGGDTAREIPTLVRISGTVPVIEYDFGTHGARPTHSDKRLRPPRLGVATERQRVSRGKEIVIFVAVCHPRRQLRVRNLEAHETTESGSHNVVPEVLVQEEGGERRLQIADLPLFDRRDERVDRSPDK